MEKLLYKECETCKDWNGSMQNCFEICRKPFDALVEFNKYKQEELQLAKDNRIAEKKNMRVKIKDFIDDAKENEYWSSLPIEEFESIEELKETIELCYDLKLSVETKAEHSNFYQGVLFSVANKE